MRPRIAPCLALLGFLTPALSAAEVAWPNTAVNRWQAEALIQGLNAEILAARSATAVLEHWCGAHRLAAEAKLVAEPVANAAIKSPTPEQRERLGVGPDEPVKYRHVRLRCGDHVLSEADNFYVPSRLTPDMNQALETTDIPFGKVVKPLEPHRRTFATKTLWSAVAAPKEAAALPIPPDLFEHRAVLYTRYNLPFSEVDEVYRRDLLDFSPEP
jgi:chorismate-pyruvate lyase